MVADRKRPRTGTARVGGMSAAEQLLLPTRVLDTIRQLAARQRGDELVGLVDLRQELRSVPRDALDAELLGLERNDLVDLKIANAPARLPEDVAKAGLHLPNAGGLACWVVRRPQPETTFTAPIEWKLWRAQIERFRRPAPQLSYPVPLNVETAMGRAALVVAWDHRLQMGDEAPPDADSAEGRAALISYWAASYCDWGQGFDGGNGLALVDAASAWAGVDLLQQRAKLAHGWSPHVIAAIVHALWIAREPPTEPTGHAADMHRRILDVTDRLFLATSSREPRSLEELGEVVDARWPEGFDVRRRALERFLVAQGAVLDAHGLVVALLRVQAGHDLEDGAESGAPLTGGPSE